MSKEKKSNKKHKGFIWGRCPLCGHLGSHKLKGFTYVVDVGDTSRFKCKRCKKMFGFQVTE